MRQSIAVGSSAGRLLLLAILFAAFFAGSCSDRNGGRKEFAEVTRPETPAQGPSSSRAAGTAATRSAKSVSAEHGFTMLDGRHARLSDYLGQVLVLDLYATWCLPCRKQVPHLIALQRRYGREGLQIIGLNVGGDEDRNAVPGFVEEYGIQYRLGFPDPEMSDQFFADDSSIPQTYVFDRQGRLAKRFIGYSDEMPDELEQVIKDALAAKTE